MRGLLILWMFFWGLNVCCSEEIKGFDKPQTVFKNIQWKELKKSQFETKQEYSSRMERLSPSAKLFVVEVSPNQAKAGYNADKKILTVGLYREITSCTGQRGSASRFTLDSWLKPTSETEEQNAFGAKAKVQNYSGEAYEVNVLNYKDVPRKFRPKIGYSDGIFVPIEIEAQKAKHVLESSALKLILIFSIENLEGAGQYFQGSNATIDSPTFSFQKVFELPVKLRKVFVYDALSKERLIEFDVAKK